MHALKHQMDDSGVLIRTMCLSGHRKYPLGSYSTAIRERLLEMIRKAVGLTAELGIAIIQLAEYDLYYEPGDADTRAGFAENLTVSTGMAARSAVLPGFETMKTAFMVTIGKVMAYVNLVGSPYLGGSIRTSAT